MTRDCLLLLLDNAYRSSPYHSLLGSLRGLTEAEASWIPPGYRGFEHMTGSILDIGFHAAGDKRILMDHAFEVASTGWDTLQKEFTANGSGLRAVRLLAEASHNNAYELLAHCSEESLSEPPPAYHGRDFTRAELVRIVAEHDLYHAGQIQFIRRLLEGGLQTEC